MEDEGEMYVDEFDEDYFGEAGSEIDMEHDHYDMFTRGTDTSASQARKGKDIQGIPWDRLNITREKYRQTRIEQYKNYENVPSSGAIIDKECKQIEKGSEYYGFQHNTRLVKPTILHFQLRNLVWATSKHDVYLMSNYSVIHWSSLSCNMSEVINFSGHVAPNEKHAGSLLEGFMQTQISTLAVKNNLLIAGGFQGEITCKKLDGQGISFCTRTTFEDNAITNAIDIYDSPSGGIHFMASNNDCGLREFDAEEFQLLNHFTFPWPVNHTSMSPDCKLILVVGDHPDGLLVDSQNGKVVSSMVGHVDYSFASAWHPDGRIFATGNQDKTCRVWDIRNLSSSVAVLKGNLGAVRSIRFSSDGQFMAVAEPADFVHIYNTNMNYKKRQEIDFFGEVSGISLSPDDESLFIGVWDRTYASLLHYSKKHEVLLQGFLREEEHHHGLVYGSMSDPHAHRSDSHGSLITIEGGDPTWPSDLDNGPPLKVGPIDGTAGEGDSTKKLLTATQEALVAAQTPMETPSQDIGIEETAAAGDKFNKDVHQPIPASWASLFVNNSRAGPSQLKFVPPAQIEGKQVVQVKLAEHAAHISVCESYLIGNFVGRRLAYGFVKDSLKRLWGLKGDFDMSVYGDRAFVFKFLNENDRTKVLEQGPVHIASRLFMVRPWKPYMEDNVEVHNSIPIWINLRRVPLFLWSPAGLEAIASAVGMPIMLDKATENKTRLAFARVCVEISVKSDFPSTIQVNIDDGTVAIVDVEYSWRPAKCTHCNGFGHTSLHCPKHVKAHTKVTKARRPKAPVPTPVTTPPDHVNGGQEQHGQQSSGGSSSGQDEGWETPARRHTCKPSKASVTQDAGCSVSECKTREYSANSRPDSANVSLDVSANAEVAAESGLSTPISNSEETPMQVVDVLRAVTGIDKHGVDPSALMDRLSPQAITALNSQIARIGSDALVTEIKSLLGVEAAKVGQTSIAEEHAVSTLPPPTEYEPRRSS